MILKYGSPVRVYKLDLSNGNEPKVEMLPKLKRKARDFAVANFKNKFVYLSGGLFAAGKRVSAYNTKTQKWTDMP